MKNEKKNHSLPASLNFPTPEQLQNSIDALGGSDPGRREKYQAMKPEARARLVEHLENEQRRGALPKREQKVLRRELDILKQK